VAFVELLAHFLQGYLSITGLTKTIEQMLGHGGALSNNDSRCSHRAKAKLLISEGIAPNAFPYDVKTSGLRE
jgi:hypothetical protein